MNTLGNSLFSLVRDGFEEIRGFGELVIVDGNGVFFHSGEITGHYPARSLLKPFQFYAAKVPVGEWENDPRYTACLGSISATAEQVEQLREWWKGSPLVDKLALPPSYPMDDRHRVALKNAHEPAQKIFHTCFSKHLGILAGCLAHGWSFDGYLTTSHPYHAQLKHTLAELLGGRKEDFAFVTDGCQLPSPVLTLREMAELYRQLAVGSELAKVRDLMLRKPEWIGGPHRLDTRWMEANPGRVIAKEGADGLWGIGVLPDAKYPSGLGIVLKLAAGFHPPLAAIALSRALEFLGLKSAHEVPKGQQAIFHYSLEPRTSEWIDISPLVDEKLAVWPGDVAYRRQVSFDTLQGQHMTLSSIETTVHLGAHTDGPNHFEAVPHGIESVDIAKYAGAAQVVTVRVPRGGVIRPADLDGVELRAPRVLFHTASYPDPAVFNTDFVALSAELVEFLQTKKVCLVGIDTPSIDPSDSKELAAHHATTRARMAVLEGIVLDNVRDGLYELHALPLRLRGADASPVRAVLKKLD